MDVKIGVYHHVTGIDASSSASLAAYINTLTNRPLDKQNKVVSGLYWCVQTPKPVGYLLTSKAATMRSPEWICEYKCKYRAP